MKEDLIIKDEASEPLEDAIEFETTSRSEYISSAYYAIAAVSEIDTELMQPLYKKRKKEIIRKSLRIIDNIISELDGELFEAEDDSDYEEDNL